MTTVQTPRWRIELQTESPHNPEQWVELRSADGKRYRFLERSEAETEIATLLKYQPHIRGRLRITAI